MKAWLIGGMRILMFHGIDDEHPPEVLEAQLRYLTRHFSIVPLSSVLDWMERAGTEPANPVALTFDDGLRNQYTQAYPVLRRLGVPATFYVCPGLIEEGRWLWNHETRERLRSLCRDARTELCGALEAPAAEVEEVVAWMKSLPGKARAVAEATIRAATPGFKPTSLQSARYDVMSWEELGSLDPELVTIGSHTMSHPVLTSIDTADASREILESAQWLEQRLKRPVEHFCYPNGANDPSVVAHVRRRYRTAVTTEAGVVIPGEDVHRLKRIPSAESLELLAWRLHRPTA